MKNPLFFPSSLSLSRSSLTHLVMFHSVLSEERAEWMTWDGEAVRGRYASFTVTARRYSLLLPSPLPLPSTRLLRGSFHCVRRRKCEGANHVPTRREKGDVASGQGGGKGNVSDQTAALLTLISLLSSLTPRYAAPTVVRDVRRRWT